MACSGDVDPRNTYKNWVGDDVDVEIAGNHDFEYNVNQRGFVTMQTIHGPSPFKRMGAAIVICAMVAVAACANSRTYLKNPATGEVVKCGSVHPVTLAEWAVQNREAQCISDFKEQGFVRVSGPK